MTRALFALSLTAVFLAGAAGPDRCRLRHRDGGAQIIAPGHHLHRAADAAQRRLPIGALDGQRGQRVGAAIVLQQRDVQALARRGEEGDAAGLGGDGDLAAGFLGDLSHGGVHQPLAWVRLTAHGEPPARCGAVGDGRVRVAPMRWETRWHARGHARSVLVDVTHARCVR